MLQNIAIIVVALLGMAWFASCMSSYVYGSWDVISSDTFVPMSDGEQNYVGCDGNCDTTLIWRDKKYNITAIIVNVTLGYAYNGSVSNYAYNRLFIEFDVPLPDSVINNLRLNLSWRAKIHDDYTQRYAKYFEFNSAALDEPYGWVFQWPIGYPNWSYGVNVVVITWEEKKH